MRLALILSLIAVGSSFQVSLVRSELFDGSSDKLRRGSLVVNTKSSHVVEAGFLVMTSSEKKTAWPELVGMAGDEAKTLLESQVTDKQISIVPSDRMVTMDYRVDRIRIFVDKDGKVERAPQLG